MDKEYKPTLWSRFRNRSKRRYLRVGDIAPEGPITGAMIAVDPETNRITAIFQP